jgi:hypothetical protein
MLQNPSADSDKNFDRIRNRSGESKESIDKLEYVMFPICVNVITQANIVFCIYGDMGKVIENACAIVNVSPSFLQHTKQKPIKLSTLKNKLTEWQRDLRSERDVCEMGADVFYDLGTHSNSTKLVIQIVRMQEVALQRQDHERVNADPARNDPNIALAVCMPGPRGCSSIAKSPRGCSSIAKSPGPRGCSSIAKSPRVPRHC